MDEKKFDEKTVLKEIQKEFNNLGKSFIQLSNIKTSDPEALDKLEKALKNIPAGEVFGKVLEEKREKAQMVISEIRQVRAESFNRIVTEFIKQSKAKGDLVRESGAGWRVGVLEFQVKPELSQIRFLYNRETVVNWVPVREAEDILKVRDKVLTLLQKALLPEKVLVEVTKDAYDKARQGRNSGLADINLVPIREFYREFRIALVRSYFASKSPGSKLDRYIELPQWAFLYNMDSYRALVSSIPVEKRMGFQTGSQQEVSQGKGMVINGLDPMQDYKVMCYVIAK